MPTDLIRRQFCARAAAAAAAAAAGGLATVIAPHAHAQPIAADHGRVIPPLPVPDVPVRRADGAVATLGALVQGYATALHLMFTGCSTVCPIQGAIFERTQSLLPDQRERGIRLLSLSIDPLGDTPAAMQAWLGRFHARDGWIAAAPQPAGLEQLLEIFGQGRNTVENHVTQVNIIDRQGRLVFKTQQLPSADSIAALLRQV